MKMIAQSGAHYQVTEADAGEVRALQDVQRAILNILEDFEMEKARLEATQRAVLNILEDFDIEKARLEDAQRATINILDDLNIEKSRVEEASHSLQIEIAERVRTENELKIRTEEVETTNKELEAFSYSVSHDLRAPLRGIDGFCQALVEDCAESLDEQGKDYLKRIQAATVRMGQLVDDLLDLSKVNRAQLQRSKVDLSALARGLAKELQQRDPEREVEFRIQTGLVADADQQLMGIVLTNLLENAWKFTSKQKQARIEFGALPSAKETAYFVRDNGDGFDMVYVNKLFAPFQRLHTANQFPGTGIGLATVQRIILRHGGRVWAEGEKGNGASFYFSFPLHVPM